MTPEVTVDIFREAVSLLILIVGVLVLPALGVGLVISMIQAATQINEQTLSFLPRLFVVFLVFIFTGPWLLRLMVELTQRIFQDIPILIG